MQYGSPPKYHIEYPQIPVYVPHKRLEPATQIALIGYNVIPVATIDDYDYQRFFQDRWKDGTSFVNVEQDIIPWPGAIKEIWDCPHEWCVFDFHLPVHWNRNLEDEKIGIPIGCVKISASLIQKTPGMWDEPVTWDKCDMRLTQYAISHNVTVHQHRPGVVNANPALMTIITYG